MYTSINLCFKGESSLTEAYNIHLKDLRDSLKVLTNTKDKIRARLELLELLAIVDNSLAREYKTW